MPKKDKNNTKAKLNNNNNNNDDVPFAADKETYERADKAEEDYKDQFDDETPRKMSQYHHPKPRRRVRKSPYDFRLYDVEDVRKKLKIMADSYRSNKEKSTLELMEKLGGVTRLRKQPKHFEAILNKLEVEYPHFSNVTKKLRSRMKLNNLQQHPTIDFGRGLLLTGPAGTGKSSFLFKLSEALQTEFSSYSCAATSNAFDIVGLSSKWGNGSAGEIHELLVEKECPNPIILLDEIEKVSDNDAKFSSLKDALYGLLEKNNARYFSDEFVGQTMDASKINWFATANDSSLLPAPIKDRFDVIKVRAPTSRELQSMVPNLYASILIELNVYPYFTSKLDKDVINILSLGAGASIRRIKAVLEEGMTNAVNRHQEGKKVSIKVEDVSGLNFGDDCNSNAIGFIWNTGGDFSQSH